MSEQQQQMHPEERRKTAPARGTYTIDGIPYQVNEGDPIPEGAEFVAAAEEEGEAAAKTPAKKGPTETTQAAGPKETG